jgi:aryl-phospho-beta-D-glucosidase BglC (GH1 family)
LFQGNFAPNDFESSYGCPSPDLARSQMQHFSNKDGFNAFRLPVPWQSLVSNNLTINKLDDKYFDKYNQLVQICLDTSANTHCM